MPDAFSRSRFCWISVGRAVSFLLATLGAIAFGQQPLLQIEASLVLPKGHYLVGEPIELEFLAKNVAQSGVTLSESDPYGQCGAYRVKVTAHAATEIAAKEKSGNDCQNIFSIEEIECLSGDRRIAAGALFKERILLNKFRDFSQPGVYQIQASRDLASAADFGGMRQTKEVAAVFTIRIDQVKSPLDLRSAFAPYLRDLTSADSQRQREAVLAISTLPAPFLEPYLLQMMSSAEFRSLAIAGLSKLNTPGGRRALFGFLGNGQQLSSDQQLAAVSLGKMRDERYGPLLLDLMTKRKSPADQTVLLEAASRLMQAKALPVIDPLLKSQDAAERSRGVNALEATELPQVLPVLVSMLSDSSFEVRSSAARSLVSLTSRSASKDGSTWTGKDPANDVAFWSAWLRSNPFLPIHPSRECPQAQAGMLGRAE